MKKTLTVNLGGTVFHIDEDAYRLLDNYINNLKLHFRKEAGADEIVDDMERRISELFAERLAGGAQVITIADVEAVIARMGKPEDIETEEEQTGSDDGLGAGGGAARGGGMKVGRRFFRNPDDKILGGVVSGLAAYFGWDVTLCRLAMIVILVFGFKLLIPAYIVCWIVVPEARTAADKLNMRGEAVTVENIGKTVTDGFERVTSGVNDFVQSGKPRSFLQKVGDALVTVAGWVLKLCLIVLAVVFSPVLFVFAVLFVALSFAGIVVAVGGGAALLALFPTVDVLLPASPLAAIVMYIAAILMVGIPLLSLLFLVCRPLFNWQPMASGLKWTLLLLWIVSSAIFTISFAIQGFEFPDLLIYR